MNFTNKRLFKETSRVLTLGDIDEDNSISLIADILDINDIDKKIKVDKREPIRIIISSNGGEVYRGLGIIDVISNSITPIHTICYGTAMSMALPILCSGHYRMISKNSTLMYHEIIYNLGDSKLTEHIKEVKEGERINRLYNDILINNTNITLKHISKIRRTKSEWYITPDEALKLNIVDEII